MPLFLKYPAGNCVQKQTLDPYRVSCNAKCTAWTMPDSSASEKNWLNTTSASHGRQEKKYIIADAFSQAPTFNPEEEELTTSTILQCFPAITTLDTLIVHKNALTMIYSEPTYKTQTSR